MNSILAAHRRRLLLDAPAFEYYPANGDVLVPRFPAAAPVTMTFTRADASTCATRVGPGGYIETVAANLPRIDYDPVTLRCKGLLIEESRANLLTYSADFTNAAYLKTRSSASGDATGAPDRSSQADKLVEDSSAATTHYMRTTVSLAASTAYTWSVFLKAAERSACVLHFYGGGGWANSSTATVNLSAGTVVVAGTGATGGIVAYPNGWYRVYHTQTTTASAGSKTCDLELSDGSSTSYDGDGVSGLYIWGAQIEAGAFPTSYIPTTTASLTRAADACSATGTNFSSWFNSSHGTFLVESDRIGTLAFQSAWVCGDGTSNNRYDILGASSGTVLRMDVVTGGVTQASAIASSSVALNTSYRFAAAYSANDIAVCANGGTIAADTSVTLPSVDRAYVGGGATGAGAYLCGHIRRIRYYDKRIPNDQLQLMTTAW